VEALICNETPVDSESIEVDSSDEYVLSWECDSASCFQYWVSIQYEIDSDDSDHVWLQGFTDEPILRIVPPESAATNDRIDVNVFPVSGANLTTGSAPNAMGDYGDGYVYAIGSDSGVSVTIYILEP